MAGCSAGVNQCLLLGRNPYMQALLKGRQLSHAKQTVKRYSTRRSSTATVAKRSRKVKLVVTVTVAGLTYLGYKTITHKSKDEVVLAKPWQVALYRKMPLKAVSRVWGRCNEIDLPTFLRQPLLGLFIWLFSCKLYEARIEDLKQYKNLSEFFRRTLKDNVRPVDIGHELTSPADGKVLHFGEIRNGQVEQVKGVTYSLRGFLGPAWQRTRHGEDINHLSDEEFHQKLGIKPGHELYHAVIYLAPGDYHRFHSPANWALQHRRHFPGELLSVSPGIARWIQGLFNFNERVVYSGSWEHGFFSMTAVGATNVGSIKIYTDEELTTNIPTKYPPGTYFDKVFTQQVALQKGDMFGEFNLGSTIVLIFEAPKGFQFSIEGGQKIKYGEPVGTHNHNTKKV